MWRWRLLHDLYFIYATTGKLAGQTGFYGFSLLIVGRKPAHTRAAAIKCHQIERGIKHPLVYNALSVDLSPVKVAFSNHYWFVIGWAGGREG